MKKTIVSLLGAATIVVMVAGTATDASAWWQRGWGWGPGIAAGIVGGAVIAGAIIASRPPGYVVYDGYAAPVYGPGCYWASRPVYDGAGRVVGYTGRPVQVCPGYSGGPPAGGHLLAARPRMLAARPPGIRWPPACSVSGHTIRKLEPIWATMASAIPVREPACGTHADLGEGRGGSLAQSFIIG
jgi:hypothetical protein